MKYLIIIFLFSCSASKITYSGKVYDPLISCVDCDTVTWSPFIIPDPDTITTIWLHPEMIMAGPCVNITTNSDSSYTIDLTPGCKIHYLLMGADTGRLDTIYIRNVEDTSVIELGDPGNGTWSSGILSINVDDISPGLVDGGAIVYGGGRVFTSQIHPPTQAVQQNDSTWEVLVAGIWYPVKVGSSNDVFWIYPHGSMYELFFHVTTVEGFPMFVFAY